jgi:hypothetical protein
MNMDILLKDLKKTNAEIIKIAEVMTFSIKSDFSRCNMF